MTRRWLRLDVSWDESDWMDDLDGTAIGLWPRLMARVKKEGVGGRCRRPTTARLARAWRVPESAILALEAAAQVPDPEDGLPALRIEGKDWVVVKWDEYQNPDRTATERKRRQRERERMGLKVEKGGAVA